MDAQPGSLGLRKFLTTQVCAMPDSLFRQGMSASGTMNRLMPRVLGLPPGSRASTRWQISRSRR